MDDVDVYLAIVLDVDAVINLVDDLVVTSIYVVDYIALVAVDIAKIQILLWCALLLVRRLRLLRRMFRLGRFRWWQIAHAVGLFLADAADGTQIPARNQALSVVVLPLRPTVFPSLDVASAMETCLVAADFGRVFIATDHL